MSTLSSRRSSIRIITITGFLMGMNIILSAMGIPVPGGHFYLSDVVICLAGLILSAFSSVLKYLALAGIILFAVAVLAQLITLPVEFDASRRALKNIAASNILTAEELTGAKSILTAAALTYVVATLSSIVQLLRFISIFSRRR